MAGIVLSGVSFERPGRTVLRDIDLAIESGTFAAVVGPSGSGKSTLLRIMAGLEHPTAGSVSVGDRPVGSTPPPGVAMVFEDDALYEHLDVGGNLEFPARLGGAGTDDIRDIARRAGRRGRVSALWSRRPTKLSGGERGMVAFARAVARAGLDVLLLDEPLSHADGQARQRFRLDVRRIHEEVGLTTVVATNDQEEALALADLLVVLIDGEIAQVGPPREVFSRPQSTEVASFVGRLPMNLFPAQVVSEAGSTWLAVGTDRLELDQAAAVGVGDHVVVGLHAHELLPAAAGTPFGRVLRVTVSQVQDLGALTEVRFGLGVAAAGPFVMTEHRPPSVRSGDRLELTWVPGRLRLFAAGSGRAIPM